MSTEMGAYTYVCIRPHPDEPLDAFPRKYHHGWWIEQRPAMLINPDRGTPVYVAQPADPPLYEANGEGVIAQVWWLRRAGSTDLTAATHPGVDESALQPVDNAGLDHGWHELQISDELRASP